MNYRKPLCGRSGVIASIASTALLLVVPGAIASPTNPTGHVTCTYQMAMHDFGMGSQQTVNSLLQQSLNGFGYNLTYDGSWYTTDHASFPNGRYTYAQCAFEDLDEGQTSDTGGNNTGYYEGHPIMGINWSGVNVCDPSGSVESAMAIDTPEGNYLAYLGSSEMTGGAVTSTMAGGAFTSTGQGYALDAGNSSSVVMHVSGQVAPSEWGSSSAEPWVCIGSTPPWQYPDSITDVAATGTVDAYLYQ